MTLHLLSPLLWMALALLIAHCSSSDKSYEIPDEAITLMAYNVENLFDTKDDVGKSDETYLPIAAKTNQQHRQRCEKIPQKWYRKSCLEKNWDRQTLESKMKRISQVILNEKNGKGPDVVILEEVENLRVLERLRKQYLADAGYQKAILIEGPDKRGIDVGMLSRLPLAGPTKLHQLELKPDGRLSAKRIRPTRGILHARFKLPDDTILNVLGVHFPSQANPTTTRLQAISRLNQITQAIPKSELIIVGGDFNISRKEEKKSQLYKKKIGDSWFVSHKIGCKGCPGTHNYRGRWSFLDALLFSKNFSDSKSSWKILDKSIRVSNNLPVQNDPRNGKPARFEEGRSPVGVSDHWPIAAEIIPVSKGN